MYHKYASGGAHRNLPLPFSPSSVCTYWRCVRCSNSNKTRSLLDLVLLLLFSELYFSLCQWHLYYPPEVYASVLMLPRHSYIFDGFLVPYALHSWRGRLWEMGCAMLISVPHAISTHNLAGAVLVSAEIQQHSIDTTHNTGM